MTRVITLFMILQCMLACTQNDQPHERHQVADTLVQPAKALGEHKKEEINGMEVILKNDNGKGVLVYNNQDAPQEVKLLIPWPTDFHRDKAGNVRTVKNNNDVFFLLENSGVDSLRENSCQTHLQSARLSGNTISVSEVEQVVASCPPFQWDEFIFYSLFDKK